MRKIKVIVTGATGRMGQTIIRKVLGDKSLKLIGALEISGHKKIGQDIGKILKTKNIGIKISDNIIDLFSKTKIADGKWGLIEILFFRFVVNYNSWVKG